MIWGKKRNGYHGNIFMSEKHQEKISNKYMDDNTVSSSHTVIAEHNSKCSLLKNLTGSRNPTRSMDWITKYAIQVGENITSL